MASASLRSPAEIVVVTPATPRLIASDLRHRELASRRSAASSSARPASPQQLAADRETGRGRHDDELRRPTPAARTIEQFLQPADEQAADTGDREIRSRRFALRRAAAARRARGESTRCTPSPAAIAAASTARVARLHRR